MEGQLQQFLADEETQEAFLTTVSQVLGEQSAGQSIGTLAEKSIHSILKRYESKGAEAEEVPVSGYVADVMTGQGIVEVQTRQFYKMKRKLTCFLEQGPVTVVYPVVYKKRLSWVDPDTGEVSAARNTGRRQYGHKLLAELYGIRELVAHANFRARLMLLEVDERKLLNGYGEQRKIRASRQDGVPTKLVAAISLQRAEEYAYFVPEGLAEPFTSKEYGACCKIDSRLAGVSLHMLTQLGVVSRVGKQGTAFLYVRSKNKNEEER